MASGSGWILFGPCHRDFAPLFRSLQRTAQRVVAGQIRVWWTLLFSRVSINLWFFVLKSFSNFCSNRCWRWVDSGAGAPDCLRGLWRVRRGLGQPLRRNRHRLGRRQGHLPARRQRRKRMRENHRRRAVHWRHLRYELIQLGLRTILRLNTVSTVYLTPMQSFWRFTWHRPFMAHSQFLNLFESKSLHILDFIWKIRYIRFLPLSSINWSTFIPKYIRAKILILFQIENLFSSFKLSSKQMSILYDSPCWSVLIFSGRKSVNTNEHVNIIKHNFHTSGHSEAENVSTLLKRSTKMVRG